MNSIRWPLNPGLLGLVFLRGFRIFKIFGHTTSGNGGKKTESGWMPPVVFQHCSTPSKPKYALWADLHGQKVIFGRFGPLFGPLWAIFGTFRSVKWANWSAWMSLVPFQPCSNIAPRNRWSHLALIGTMPMSALFCPFGPWEGTNMRNTLCSNWKRGQFS